MDTEINQNLINFIPTNCESEPAILTIQNTYNYNDFFENFLLHNKPCIIKNVSENWNAAKYWIKHDRPDFDYLKAIYGNCDVTIYNCEEKYYNSQKTLASKFGAYIDYWVNSEKTDLYYLKDWHLKNQMPLDDFYEVPKYFSSDWLNEYLCENQKDDYRFVYMGPKKTWTPFHQDVFSSYSWSVNLCGQKHWILFPPGEESRLKDSLGNLPYDISTVATNNVPHYDLIQNRGEAIFVPSGWYHQVWNLSDTISINHNWINGCNIHKMWQSLKDNLDAVQIEIEDCKNMDNYIEHCQIMLAASFGLNFLQFYQLMKYIALKRMKSADKVLLGRNHLLFDLKRIEDVLSLFLENDDVKKLADINCDDVINLLQSIKNCVYKNKNR